MTEVNLRRRDHLEEDIDVDGRILFKLGLKKYGVRVRTGLN
jgi:hypothetical protein